MGGKMTDKIIVSLGCGRDKKLLDISTALDLTMMQTVYCLVEYATDPHSILDIQAFHKIMLLEKGENYWKVRE
jgi:hypothetical protein